MSDPLMAASMERDMRARFLVALLLTMPIVLPSSLGESLFGYTVPADWHSDWLMLALATPVVFWSGSIFITGAWHALRNRTLDMSVLIATGVLAAYFASLVLLLIDGDEVFFDAAAMLVTFVLFGHWLEMKSRRGTSDSLRALLDLVPETAIVIRDGREAEVATADIMRGDIVVIRPGGRIPVDGEVISGHSAVDESLVTGESMPVTKTAGDSVVGGSINLTGRFTFAATLVGSETTVARIAEMVRNAQASKAPGQRIADKAAQYLVVLAVGAGVLTFVAWSVFGGVSFKWRRPSPSPQWLSPALDALSLATPTAVAVGTGIAARHNILIKNAATLEGLAAIDVVAFDKTGTLTEGKPELTDLLPFGDFSDAELLALVAAAESASEHPLARAIVAAAGRRGVSLPAVTAFQSIPGKGIVASVEGSEVRIGNCTLMQEADIDTTATTHQQDTLSAAGKTPILIAIDRQLAGLAAVADVLKPGAAASVAQFHAMGIETVMITGDNRRTAEAVARQLGIDRVFAEVLPEHKAAQIADLQIGGKRVAMVGDGVNDAPALAQADIGIAIGAGTDVAIETADVVLMKSDPRDIERAMRLSRETVRKMEQNLGWASIYNILAIPIAAGALYPAYGLKLPPEASALLMSFSSLIVALNAVSLKRVGPALENVSSQSTPSVAAPRPIRSETESHPQMASH
ncbi:MAG: copper-translocating P-type ATPase [Thermomicrobiales bacterium]